MNITTEEGRYVAMLEHDPRISCSVSNVVVLFSAKPASRKLRNKKSQGNRKVKKALTLMILKAMKKNKTQEVSSLQREWRLSLLLLFFSI